MKKTTILTLITALTLSISPVFAQTLIQETSASDSTVDDIIAEIEQAKSAATKLKAAKAAAETVVPAQEETVLTAEIAKSASEADALAKDTKSASEAIEEEEVAVTAETTKPASETAALPKEVQELPKPATEVKEKIVAVQEKQEEKEEEAPRRLTITIPTVPETPKAIKLSSELRLVDEHGHIIIKNLNTLYPERKEIIFSTNVAPERFNKKNKDKDKEEVTLLGSVDNARVTAYLQSPLLSVDEVIAKLKQEKFEILSTFKVDKKGTVTSIVYTNDAIKSAASKNMRGFAGALRIVVDNENKLVNISNPIYMLKAFMQKEYNPSVAQKVLTQIHNVFPDLKASTEVVKFLALERYQFMENMPFYQDMKVVAEAKNAELLKRAQKSKKIVYEQHLDNGSIILGVELGSRTSKFVKKIGYQNSGLLPYPVLIENGEAKILAPQYYIAVMYPKLKMSKFMTIATVPGAINKDIDKIFR